MTERIRIYNPEEVYNKETIGRKILYLEHNIWIDLCAMNTVESKKTLSNYFSAPGARYDYYSTIMLSDF